MAENCDTGFDPAEDSYRIRLNEFEGPLDLLLHLIKKDEINIYDIPIATITKQYLDYIKMMKSLNLVVAGEFLVMAATLIHIKSRMLLPVESDGDDEDETDEDPRAELVRRLLEYKRFKEAAASWCSAASSGGRSSAVSRLSTRAVRVCTGMRTAHCWS